MLLTTSLLLVLAVTSGVECVRNTPRSARASRNEGSLDFECPEEFGYYPHPRDCTQYYVCVFGGALLESCTGGLMYSHELQTCDWPRNVGCLNGGSIAKETVEDDLLLERAAKAESVELHQEVQHHQSRHQQRQPIQRQQSQATVTSSSPPVSPITERHQSRHRQQQQQQQQPQHQHRTYEDVEYEPATEIESDRQQRVYRGQPSTIGQVQRDRDGLRRNIISVSHPPSSSSSSSSSSTLPFSTLSLPIEVSTVTPRKYVSPTNINVVSKAATTHDRINDERTSDSSTTSSFDSPVTQRFDYTTENRATNYNDAINNRASTQFSKQSVPIEPKAIKRPDTVRQASRLVTLPHPNEASAFSLSESNSPYIPATSRSILKRPQSQFTETSFASPTSLAAHWQRSSEEFEKNEISASSVAPRQRATSPTLSHRSEEASDEQLTATMGFPRQRQRSKTDHQPSSASWLRTSEELERNEISVSPGTAGRGFMIKRLRSESQDSTDDIGDSSLGVTEAYASQRASNDDKQVTINPSIRQRPRDIPTKAFDEPENRKYYAVTIPVGQPRADTPELVEAVDYTRTRKVPVNPIQLSTLKGDTEQKKYYIPSVQHPRGRHNDVKSVHRHLGDRRNTDDIDIPDPTSSNSQQILPDRTPKRLPLEEGLTLEEVSTRAEKMDGGSVKTTTTVTTTTTSVSASIASPEDPSRNEVSAGSSSSGQRSEVGLTTSGGGEADGDDTNEIPSSNLPLANGTRGRQRTLVRGQSRHRTREDVGTSRPEREKDSVVNSRGQTETHYRAISSESPRTAKTTASTSAPISKSYYNDPDQSYPYYTIYDDDVSIYKDDDYAQYTVNRTVQIPPQQQLQHHQHQHQNVRIAEVTPNSNQYSQKPKKVTVNDADKYNVNPEVTVSDYDIYDNQPLKNKFRISDGQQSLRTNGLSHPAVHVTTPNAIIDNYVPLTTTTPPPPTTTSRPFTVTLQNRGRPQVNRGTAPPRLRPTLKPSTAIVSKAQEFVDIYRYPPVRPGPIYPTPTVDKPAAKCRKDVCLLPDCNCGGTDIPGGIPAEKIPQIVLLTFDDAVNDLNKQLYEDLFEKGRKNPNGCPISATFYVSHEWTDYSQVQNLYADGHELASHTVSHSFGEQFSARKWSREVAGQREILAAYGGVKLEDVRGMRAPFLSVGGNNMFKMLWDTNFTYDSSMPIYENRPPSWPYTLDYKLFHDCMIPPCPTRSYPGLWEVPMVMWQDLNGGRCSMGDACSNPPTPDGVYKMLIKNFERHYTTNRAPFGLFYHAAWFTQAHHKEGFISFLDTIVAMDDVWVVTNWQALQWVRNPTPLEHLDRFEPFGCNYPDRPKKCNNAKVCNLWHKSGVRYMKTCQACPDIYPWTGKTGIRSSRIDNEIEN